MKDLQKPQVKPYNQEEEKKSQVGKMFDNIAQRYDLLNRVLSAGIDQVWRARATKRLNKYQQATFLDVASGTGDLAIMLAEKLKPKKVMGIDISNNMLEIGKKKVLQKNLGQTVELMWADAEHLPFDTGTFDGVTVGFGVRNFGNLQKGVMEMGRVLKPGGKLVVLEFSRPRIFGFRHLYDFYFKYVLPFIGKWTSKDPRAYRYLYESVQAFPDYEGFVQVLKDSGLKQCSYHPQTLGICCIYEATK